MPKNLTGGKNAKRGKRKVKIGTGEETNLELAGKNQIYALVRKKLGGSRLLVMCSDKKERSARIPGKFFKKVWMNVGDIVLCNLNPDLTDSECYIVYKYSNKEAHHLRTEGKISFEEEENDDFFIPGNISPEDRERNSEDERENDDDSLDPFNNDSDDDLKKEEIPKLSKKNLSKNSAQVFRNSAESASRSDLDDL